MMMWSMLAVMLAIGSTRSCRTVGPPGVQRFARARAVLISPSWPADVCPAPNLEPRLLRLPPGVPMTLG